MSGPKTATIIVDPVSVLLVAAGLRAARAVQQGHEQAATLRAQHERERDSIQARLQQADAEHLQQLQASEAEERGELASLLHIAQQLGLLAQVQASCPQPHFNAGAEPGAGDADSDTTTDTRAQARRQYVQALQEWNAQVRSLLRLETARRMLPVAPEERDAASGRADAMPAHTAAGELALPPDTGGHEAAPAAPAVAEDGKTLARRLLARMTELGEGFARIPDEIRQAALALAACPPGERATLLASDLRWRIQQHIEAVVQGMAQQAAGFVVQQTLQDLGYQVEPIAETLFVEGGVVHFRRAGWGDYMVRMRINPAQAAQAANANFNVLRAVSEATNEISVQDHIAEDRWCSEFPALLQALAARGVQLQVTRHLAAGELPVQQVPASRLPKFADEDLARPGARQAARRPLP